MPSETNTRTELPRLAPADAEASTPVPRRRERLAAATGIVFVALQLALPLLLAGAPAADDPVPVIRAYLVDHGGNLLTAATLDAVAAFFFLWFLGSLRARLATAEGPPGQLTTIAVGAGLVTIALAVTASLPAVALAWNDSAASADSSLLRAIWNLSTLAFVPIGASAAAFALAVALIVFHTRFMPAWIGWIGVLATILGVVSIFELLADGPNTLLELANVAGFLSGIAFILLLSVFMVIHPNPAASTT